jgi:phosphate transport system permease protein
MKTVFVQTSTSALFQPERGALSVRRRLANTLAITLTGLFALAASVFLLYLIGYVAVQGLRFINVDFFTQRPRAEGELGGGWATALQGTAILVAIATLVGVPLGMATGIYLSEFGRGWLSNAVRFLVDTLTGIPTIIFGLFAWAILVVTLHSFSALSGGVALSIIMVPTVARATEEVLRLVPRELREASIALGATESRTILRVVVPAARSGIITGVLLAVARVAGETAPLLLTAFGTTFFNTNLLRPIDAIPLRMFNFTLSPFQAEQNQAYAGALVLIVFVIATSFAVRLATGGFKPRGW